MMKNQLTRFCGGRPGEPQCFVSLEIVAKEEKKRRRGRLF